MESSNTNKTVTTLVEEYMQLSENTDDSLRLTYLIRGKHIWKDIRNNVLKIPSNQWILVDKSKKPFRAQLTKCCDLLMTVSVFDDCGKLVPLSSNESINIVDYVKLENKCECNNEIKSCLESSEETITETITIENTPYTQTTTKTIYENGDVFISTVGPITNCDEMGKINSVSVGVVSNKLICKLETKECGCIDATEENLIKIKDCFCEKVYNSCVDACNKSFRQPENTSFKNKTGYYRENKKVIYFEGNIPDQVLITYKSNGESEDEELIPDFVSMTFFKGMDDINTQYSKTANRFEKSQAKTDYTSAKNELELNLPRNMILISEWIANNSINLNPW